MTKKTTTTIQRIIMPQTNTINSYSLDKHYTPEDIATALVNQTSLEQVNTVADFAAGGGSLLSAAKRKWKSCKITAVDKDRESTRLLSKFEDWDIFHCDFLDNSSHPKNLTKLEKTFDLIVLNPPYSYRGGSKIKIELGISEQLYSSIAGAFILNSLKFLRKGGEILCILPKSFFSSEKDETTRQFLRTYCKESLSTSIPAGAFKGTFAETVIASYKLTSHEWQDFKPSNQKHITGHRIIRGTIPKHKAHLLENSSGTPFVHTTGLRNNYITAEFKVNHPRSKIEGPAILLPRVGMPDIRKIAIVDDGQEYAISDCILGIKCSSTEEAKTLMSVIMSNWNNISSQYQGTCAKYITIQRLSTVLGNYV